MNVQTLRKLTSNGDPGYVSFEGKDRLDLSGLDALGPLWCLDIERAYVTSLPTNYDWSPLKYVGLRWHPCWTPVLILPTIPQIAIADARQEALSLLDRTLEDTDGKGQLILDQPVITPEDSWFPSNFSCPRVTIDGAKSVDFANAGAFGSIDHLILQNIKSLRNLPRFSQLGRLGIVVLEDAAVLDPESFWNISAARIVIVANSRKAVSWFYGIWDDRPDDWRDKIRFSGFIADDLYPEWSYIDVFEGCFDAVESKPRDRHAISEERFWEIIARANTSSDGTLTSLLEALGEELCQATPEEIVAFDQEFAVKSNALYNWDLWGVAHLMLEGCSPETFSDIRAWIVALGSGFYRACLNAPVTLANGRLHDHEEIPWMQAIRHVPNSAYADLTGSSIDEDYPDQLSSSLVGVAPEGEPWDPASVAIRFPAVKKL